MAFPLLLLPLHKLGGKARCLFILMSSQIEPRSCWLPCKHKCVPEGRTSPTVFISNKYLLPSSCKLHVNLKVILPVVSLSHYPDSEGTSAPLSPDPSNRRAHKAAQELRSSDSAIAPTRASTKLQSSLPDKNALNRKGNHQPSWGVMLPSHLQEKKKWISKQDVTFCSGTCWMSPTALQGGFRASQLPVLLLCQHFSC